MKSLILAALVAFSTLAGIAGTTVAAHADYFGNWAQTRGGS